MKRSLRKNINKKKPKLQAGNPGLTDVIDIFENDESATYLLGSPGYRVARGRSGLGWIETQAELAQFLGMMIRSLFTGDFHKTKDPIVLFGMIFCGIFLAGIPLALVLAELILDRNPWDSLWFIFTFPNFLFGSANLLVGVAVLVNAVKNIRGQNQ